VPDDVYLRRKGAKIKALNDHTLNGIFKYILHPFQPSRDINILKIIWLWLDR